jgi:hypothetical protein
MEDNVQAQIEQSKSPLSLSDRTFFSTGWQVALEKGLARKIVEVLRRMLIFIDQRNCFADLLPRRLRKEDLAKHVPVDKNTEAVSAPELVFRLPVTSISLYVSRPPILDGPLQFPTTAENDFLR